MKKGDKVELNKNYKSDGGPIIKEGTNGVIEREINSKYFEVLIGVNIFTFHESDLIIVKEKEMKKMSEVDELEKTIKWLREDKEKYVSGVVEKMNKNKESLNLAERKIFELQDEVSFLKGIIKKLIEEN